MTEKERIQATNKWPHHPRLPMKRSTGVGFPELGFICSRDVDDDGPIALYKGCMFSGGGHGIVKFETLDALLVAGWRGD